MVLLLRASLATLVALPLLAASSAAAPRAADPCRPAVRDAVLPAWARTGFNDPRPRMRYALGRDARIAALLFAFPLQAPAPKDHNNKILWVSRLPTAGRSDLVIRAQRMRGAAPVGKPVVQRVAGAPGPSSVDVPVPGCWRVTLSWSGRVDSLDLRYARS